MNADRKALSRDLGLGLLAFSALLFFKPFEDAYTLPQSLILAFAALGLLAGSIGRFLPFSAVFGLGLGMYAWRFFCHFVSPDAPANLLWLAVQVPQLALFLGCAVALREAATRRKLAVALMVAGALGSAYALLSPLGWDPFGTGAADLGFGRRAHGTLGNPDFLGGWLAMLLPLGLVCAASCRSRVRCWAAGASALMGLALLLTLARGAWAAAAVGCVVGLMVLGWKPGRGTWAWVLGLTALGALVLALGPGFGTSAARLKEGLDLRSDAWGSRAFMDSVALDLAREHPVTGVGGGAFEMEYLRRQGERLWSEPSQPFRMTADAHNDWLQAAAETGFPGLAIWGLLFLLALRVAWREGGTSGAAVAGALAAFGVQACFHFPWDIVPTSGLVLAGLGAAAGFGPAQGVAGPQVWPILPALAVVACLFLDFRWAASSAFLNSGTELTSTTEGRRLGAALLKRSADLCPSDERAWSRLGAVQMELSEPLAAALSFQNALQALPSASGDWTNLGLCLGLTGSLQGSVASLRQAVLLDPRSNEAWADEAKAEYLLGHTDDALRLAREGMAQAGGSAQAWFNLGAMLYNAGRLKEAAPAFEAALRFDAVYPHAASLLEACRAH